MKREMQRVWRGWIAVAAVVATLAVAAVKLGRDPEWRSALSWIARSWLRPADTDARWEQRKSAEIERTKGR